MTPLESIYLARSVGLVGRMLVFHLVDLLSRSIFLSLSFLNASLHVIAVGLPLTLGDRNLACSLELLSLVLLGTTPSWCLVAHFQFPLP